MVSREIILDGTEREGILRPGNMTLTLMIKTFTNLSLMKCFKLGKTLYIYQYSILPPLYTGTIHNTSGRNNQTLIQCSVSKPNHELHTSCNMYFIEVISGGIKFQIQ